MGVFSNPLMGSAAMDRLVHRGIKIVIQGQSYRLESFMKRAKSRASDNEPEQIPEELRTTSQGKNPKERQGGEKRAS